MVRARRAPCVAPSAFRCRDQVHGRPGEMASDVACQGSFCVIRMFER